MVVGQPPPRRSTPGRLPWAVRAPPLRRPCDAPTPPPPPRPVARAPCPQCFQRPEPIIFACEPYIEGRYVKYSNNWGFVSSDDRNTPHAFSHFTHYVSGGKYIVVDVQVRVRGAAGVVVARGRPLGRGAFLAFWGARRALCARGAASARFRTPFHPMAEVTAVTTVFPRHGTTQILTQSKDSDKEPKRTTFPTKNAGLLSKSAVLSCGHSSPGGGWL